ncbi:hypothetical protein Bca4012_045382 [Brassica carinata]
MAMTMSDGLQLIRFPKGISGYIPPPGFAPRATLANARLNELFRTPITSRRLSETFTGRESRRVQKLLGISDDMDAFFCAAILCRFFHIITDKYASYVAIRAMLVFDQKKYVMYEHLLHHALDIARNQYGCIALNEVITDADDPFYRNLLLDLVARNSLCLSNDPSGNFAVQHVLTLYDLRCTHNVAVSLRGHCIDLSFKKYGSYIVEKLLDTEESMDVVVTELLECEGGRLMRLARNEFGSFVVVKALRVTREINRVDLFRGLVQKLMPFRQLLLRSHGSNIANMLESTI